MARSIEKMRMLSVLSFFIILSVAESQKSATNLDNAICSTANEKLPGRNYFTYVKCLNKNGTLTPVTFCCGRGHYFDIHKKKCQSVPGGGNIVYADYSGLCKDNHKGILVHPTQKQFYYVCKSDGVLVAKCPNLNIYDPITRYCVTVDEECSITIYDESNGEAIAPKCKNSGRFGIPEQPEYFYMCTKDGDKHFRAIYKCPSGTHYDPYSQSCSQIFEITTPSSTTLGWYLESDPYPPCIKPGRFRSEANHSLYYVCSAKTNGTFYQTRFKCSPGMVYDEESMTCIEVEETSTEDEFGSGDTEFTESSDYSISVTVNDGSTTTHVVYYTDDDSTTVDIRRNLTRDHVKYDDDLSSGDGEAIDDVDEYTESNDYEITDIDDEDYRSSTSSQSDDHEITSTTNEEDEDFGDNEATDGDNGSNDDGDRDTDDYDYIVAEVNVTTPKGQNKHGGVIDEDTESNDYEFPEESSTTDDEDELKSNTEDDRNAIDDYDYMVANVNETTSESEYDDTESNDHEVTEDNSTIYEEEFTSDDEDTESNDHEVTEESSTTQEEEFTSDDEAIDEDTESNDHEVTDTKTSEDDKNEEFSSGDGELVDEDTESNDYEIFNNKESTSVDPGDFNLITENILEASGDDETTDDDEYSSGYGETVIEDDTEDIQCTTDLSASVKYDISCLSEGAFSYNNSCQLYYECAWNDEGELQPAMMECPKCLRFNEKLGYCDLPQNVPRCLQLPSNSEAKCNSTGIFSIPGVCHQYKECVFSDGEYKVKWHMCPNGENFNNITKRCDPLTICEAKPKPVCESPGSFANGESCTDFYQCIEVANSTEFVYKEYSCPPGLVYNENIGACDLPKNVPWCANIFL